MLLNVVNLSASGFLLLPHVLLSCFFRFCHPPGLTETQLWFAPIRGSASQHFSHLLVSLLSRNKPDKTVTASGTVCGSTFTHQKCLFFSTFVPSSQIDPSLIISLFFSLCPPSFYFLLRPCTRFSALLSAGVSQASVSDCYKEK